MRVREREREREPQHVLRLKRNVSNPPPTLPFQDTFIGFGGNVVREKVKKNAPWFIYNFQDLIDALEQDSIQQQQQISEMNGAVTDSGYEVSENEAIGSGPMHFEEIKVEAS